MLFACAETPKPRPGVAYQPPKPAALAPLAESPLSDSPAAKDLRAKVEALLADPKYAGSRVGVYVQSLAEDKALVRRDAHEPYIPASTMKLFTTAASLHYLSGAFRYETILAAAAEPVSGVLAGDLVVVGSGDPAIGGGTGYGGDNAFPLAGFADALKAKGIRRITGDLVGDESRFERFAYYPGWCAEDELKPYAAPSGALSLNQNCVGVTVRPGRKQGEKTSVELTPASACFVLDNTAVTAAAAKKRTNPLSVTRRQASNVIEVRGNQSIRVPERDYLLTVDDPGMFFMAGLAQTLAASGIAVDGKARLSRDPLPEAMARRIIASHISPELRELVRTTNKNSNNFYAEQLLKTIGAVRRGFGSRENGVAEVSAYAAAMGIPAADFSMTDGSGLSLNDRVSPYALVTLLRQMQRSPAFADFLASLPVAGVDGTLKRRMRGTAAEGAIQAKTGTMQGVSALAGYASGRGGKPCAFAVLVNGPCAGNGLAKALQDQIAQLVVDYASK